MRLEVDTLTLRELANGFEWRVEPCATTESENAVRSVWVTLANLACQAEVEVSSSWRGEVDVTPRSQMEEHESLRREICSPTCVAMALEYWGIPRTTVEVASGVRDAANGIYGNWPFNTAYAALQGTHARVVRLWSMGQLTASLERGVPVIVRLRWNEGQLDGAPISRSDGHLVLVRGMTDRGDVIVNDPAAPTRDTVRRVYLAAQFEPLWLASGGIAYLIDRGQDAR